MANATKPDLTIDLITTTWRPDGVRLSPDGSRVAWSAAPYGKKDEHAESAIWVAAVEGDEHGKRWTYGGADTDPQWAPDGSAIAFRSDRKERGTHGLYLLPAGGGEAAPVAVRESSIEEFCWSPDATRLAFTAPDDPDAEDKRRKDERDDPDTYGERWPYNRLLVVDIATGAVTTVIDTDLHVVEVAWSPDGAHLAFTAQDTPDPDDSGRRSLWVVRPEDGEARRLCRGSQLDGLAWADDSRLLFVAPHGHAPQASSTVWSIDVAAGSEARCLGTGPDDTACTVGVRAAADRRAALLVMEGLDSRLEWSGPDGQRSPLWTADGDISAFDVAAGTIALVVSAAAGLPEIWAGTPGDVRQKSDHHASWAAVPMGSVEDFRFTASDGLALDGILIRPPVAASSADAGVPNATVVLVHGGPYWRSGRNLHCSPLDWGQWLACAGYTVLMPNYRGGLGHGNAFAKSVRGDMGGAEWGDVMVAVDIAIERGIADPDRLGIGGWSQGGFLTAWALTNTDRFKAGVMGAGVSDWAAMAAISDLPTFETALGGDAPWDGPGPHRASERSPISYASRRHTPLLILHGQEDVRVPIGQATAFHRAVKSQDVPVELVTYPREPHAIKEARHQADLLRRVREFYARWLPL